MISLFLLHALWGTSLPIAKLLLTFSPPMLLAGTRMLASGTLLLGFAYVAKKNITLQAKFFWQYAQIIFLGKYIRYALKYWSLSAMSSTKMALIINGAPFFTAILSYILLKERLTLRQWFALFIGFCGLLLMLLTSSSTEKIIGEFFVFSLPEYATIIAIIAYCYGQIVTRKLVHNDKSHIQVVSGITSLCSGALALITSYFMNESLQPEAAMPFVYWLALLIIISNIICHLFYLHLLKSYSATFLSLTDSLSPIFTALYSWLFLYEKITWHFYASGMCVLIALVIFYHDELQY